MNNKSNSKDSKITFLVKAHNGEYTEFYDEIFRAQRSSINRDDTNAEEQCLYVTF